jgi:type III restriction enzyme
MEYWRANANRPAKEVKIEAIVLARNSAQIAVLEGFATTAFDNLYDSHRRAIQKLKEPRRVTYDKLRLASATPMAVNWQLPQSIDFNRKPTDPVWQHHLYVEEDGSFRAQLGSWEAEVLREELANAKVVGWLRNLDRKPWSMEIPYESGGETRPMFPDLIMLRNEGKKLVIDILEPHRQDLDDNFEKARGLGMFAQQHGGLFGRIQLIRKVTSAGGEHFARLDINNAATIKKLLFINSNVQLDRLFEELHGN